MPIIHVFYTGVEKGFYARVSRLGTQWLELDLHFLSLGGGEIALGWWFEECLVPYLVNTSKLEAVQSISIVTGYGKTRSRGARMNDDGMRLRVRAMLKYMNIRETPQPNKGRIHIDKAALIEVVKQNGGRIRFDIEGYTRFKEEETTANKYPDVVQQVRPRFRPARPGQGPPGTFIREGDPVPPYRSSEEKRREMESVGFNDDRRPSYRDDRFGERGPDLRNPGDGRMNHRSNDGSRNPNQRHGEEWQGGPRDGYHRGVFNGHEGYDNRGYRQDRPPCAADRQGGPRGYNGGGGGRPEPTERQPEFDDRRGNNRNWDGRDGMRPNREYNPNMREASGMERRRGDESFYHSDDRRASMDSRGDARGQRGPHEQQMRYLDGYPEKRGAGPNGRGNGQYDNASGDFRSGPEPRGSYHNEELDSPRKRNYDDYQKQQPQSRGYDVKPTAKRRSS